MLTTRQSLDRLFSRRAWHKNSGMNDSTARVFKKRFYENRLEMETQITILKACGYKVVQEMSWEEEANPELIKMKLAGKLKKENAFWSYDQSYTSGISDDILIEKVLLHLDIDDINTLFILFPKKRIKSVWKKKMLWQEPFYHQLNRLYAFLYFDVKDPDKYISDFRSKKFK